MPRGSVGQQASPGEGQAVVGEPQLEDTPQVLLPELVAVTADISTLVLKHSAFPMTEGIPYARALAVCIPGPL